MTSTPPPRTSRLTRVTAALSGSEWASVAGMVGFIGALHLIGWGVLAGIVTPHHYQVGGHAIFGAGLGLTAYTLGMRHAFDADHIAAIDNTTRKLMTEGKRPLAVGFWFSLGHSSVVFGLVTLLAMGMRALARQVENDTSTLQQTTGLIGTAVSGTFLYVIGTINLVVLLGILKVFRQMRRGVFDEAALEDQLNNRGLMNRILGGATKAVTKPWHMYPVGILFGVGFDTATEVGILVLAGGTAALSLPWYAVLTLPVLFAAGMSLLDSIDGCFMNFAYGWAFSQPVRKVFYNLTITALSVAVALIIGTIELVSVATDRLNIASGPLSMVAAINLNWVGYAVVGLFVLTWAAALLVWRFGRIEEKWSAALKTDTL